MGISLGIVATAGYPILSSEALIIRPIIATDETVWRKLWTCYLDYYESSVSEDVYASTFQRITSKDQSEPRGLLACLDGKPVGLVHYIFHRHCWKINNTCYLQDLFTAPDCRGQGVARKLIEAVYKAADDAQAENVYWLTQDFNVTARKLYDKIGVKTPFIRYDRLN